MTKFALDERFDVAICMFDTLNHLPRLELWLELFERAHETLVEDGLFIFDVNTLGLLARARPPAALRSGLQREHLDHEHHARRRRRLAPRDVQIFERLGEDAGLFRLHQETTLSWPSALDKIAEALSPHFEVIETADLDGGPVSDESSRVLFAARHRA